MTARLLAFGLALVFAASYAAAQAGADKRRSGYQDMGEALQKMQDDDTANPGMLFVQLGGQLWAKPAGAENKSCADCHGVAADSMKGVATRYPAIPQGADRPVDLAICVAPITRRPSGCRRRTATCFPSKPTSPTSRAACRSRRRTVPSSMRSARRARASIGAARASSTCPVRSATTTMPARSWRGS